ncbi:nitronate monooxygenase [Massilia sp. YIM B02763]|uniref:NAD(P)H-dependent flavin oxidoreductase n=1 Tax=Massilia sp. YIM B02763 TaxID=3050130 RepID=UPI0025B65249|nr:nitronate monooxygenase [Massilia sp. YIM B02763]MDN4055426.1 nitronate monooxygenase [Massilia sp. YIM B02763]
MKPDLLSLLRIAHPIISAPMAGVSTPALAAAVSNAGGLGAIAVGHGSAAQARSAIDALRRLTDRPFSVNVFCHRPAVPDPAREAAWLDWLAPHFAAFGAAPPATLSTIYNTFVDDDAMLELFLELRPPSVSFHFGLPDAHRIRALQDAGIVLLASATTPWEARQVEEAGIDVVVTQGYEAGGHRGTFDPENGDAAIGTFALLPLVAQAVRIPVVAAGGIMNGAGIAAALRLGAEGAQLGTAFIPCPESSATSHHRALLAAGDTNITAVTDAISGRPARGLVNRQFSDVGAASRPPVPDYPIAYDAAKALNAAAAKNGNQDYSVNWAGQAFALARAMPAAELVATLVRELAQQEGA